jgi:hypothetical protein
MVLENAIFFPGKVFSIYKFFQIMKARISLHNDARLNILQIKMLYPDEWMILKITIL